MATQYEPPFDGKPCPMCPSAWRNFAAVVHNFLGEFERNGQSERAVRKFWYVHDAVVQVGPTMGADTHPALRAMFEVADRLTARAQVENTLSREAAQELRAVYDPIAVLSEKHFADHMHSHGSRI